MTGEQQRSDAATDIETRAAAILRDSAENLDAATRSRLNLARQAALNELPVSRRPGPVWAAAATVAVAVVAVGLWQSAVPPADPVTAETPELELLLAEENLEMLEDLEFYLWLAAGGMEPEVTG